MTLRTTANDRRFWLVQSGPKVGDLVGNATLIRQAYAAGKAHAVDLVVTTELMLSGYPPEDLVLKPAFIDAIEKTVEELTEITVGGGPGLLLGTPWRHNGDLVNAVLLLDHGAIAAVTIKHELPNYQVFDEKRVFVPGPLPEVIKFRDLHLGVLICEDMWFEASANHLAQLGAELLLVINGSPFEVGKNQQRRNPALARVRETGLPLIYLNQVCGQDELVFDGGSFALNADGGAALQMPFWQSAQTCLNLHRRETGGWQIVEGEQAEEPDQLSAIYQAMMLGLRDYVTRNRFPGVVLGLSGGIDSALSAAVAVDALGADKVHCVMMPYRFTSDESLKDAQECAQFLGVPYKIIDIVPAIAGFEAMLQPSFVNHKIDITEENLQSRARGVTLMALSNKFGHMVLTTGNKSEMSTGYATLYGDMCGGYSVLKDIYKTQVFALSHWRNHHKPSWALGPNGRVMPDNVITKPPTAELRDNQKDQDSLPPYDVLDAILEGLVEQELSVDQISARGFDRAVVARVEHLLYVAEYKRRQAPPGVRISRRNFGRDRRYPITNGFRTT